MRCFVHQEVEAIGTCKSCCKGLCPVCAVDLGNGLACINSHEAKVEAINSMVERSTKLQGINTKGKFIAPTFYAFLGLSFLGYGLTSSSGSSYMIVMGLGFTVFAAVMFGINRKAFSK